MKKKSAATYRNPVAAMGLSERQKEIYKALSMMTEQQWLQCQDPRELARYIITTGGHVQRYTRAYVKAIVHAHFQRKPEEQVWFDPKLTENDVEDLAFKCCEPHRFTAFSQQEKCNVIRDIVGNPFRKIQFRCVCGALCYSFRTCWRCGMDDPGMDVCGEKANCVYSIARQIQQEKDFAAMLILADALEDAGCTNEEILNHCRGLQRCSYCLGIGTHAVDSGGQTPWGEWIEVSEPCECRNGWQPISYGHTLWCWVLRLMLGESL